MTATALLREWFKAEPWRTSRELFERLQQEYPGQFPDGQLRTLQRRVKIWRHNLAQQMVMGANTASETADQTTVLRPLESPPSAVGIS